MPDTRQWRFTVTDYHAETWPRRGTKVGLQITDGDKVYYRSTVVAEDRTRGLSHDAVVRLAWEDVRGSVGMASVEGTTFLLDGNGAPQPVAPPTVRLFEIDTTNDLERFRGEIVTPTLVFDGHGAQYRVTPAVLRYYTNLVLRQDGRLGHGTIDLVGGTSIPNIQLTTLLTIRDRALGEIQRAANVIVRITALSA
jgi:hypothetical protein